MPGAEKRTTVTELLSGSNASAIFMSAGVLPWLARKAVIAWPAASPDSSSTALKLVRTIVTPLMVAGRSASSAGASWAWPTVGNGRPPLPPGASPGSVAATVGATVGLVVPPSAPHPATAAAASSPTTSAILVAIVIPPVLRAQGRTPESGIASRGSGCHRGPAWRPWRPSAVRRPAAAGSAGPRP